MKKILCVYYSQSGQLTQIVKNFTKPFEKSGNYSITFAPIEPVNDYKFPWKGYNFFDAFPESVNHIPCEIRPLNLENEDFDLIIFAYSVWYMSPAIPSNSFIMSDQAKRIFKNKPVITLLGIRNMWVVAQEYIKEKVNELGGNLVGNIVLQDRAENLTGIVTISYFLFTGKKDRFLGFFPKPGISDKDIANVDLFGEIVKNYFENNMLDKLQEELVKAKAVKINSYLSTVERMAYKRVFLKWAGFILKKGGPNNPSRKKRVKMFAYYFPFAILVIAPIEYIFFLIFAPFRIKTIKRDKEYFSGVKLK
ncbi:MAG: hypothetical protein A2W99_02240 [Bacteroidetes bacterium GWF2_33_16]|nr:MAG: hypothetical protein A2X00_15915 [Bacteroidetes bacterium GWE2_32_14]OFY07082.1 MAG: hypothetical protein A2W99_02240 [Bacteroidetes bacterium GWF2_33_16]